MRALNMSRVGWDTQSSYWAHKLTVIRDMCQPSCRRGNQLFKEVRKSYVRVQSAILDAVLPVWSNPLLASGSPQNTSAVTSILKHCTEAVTAPASRSGARGLLSPDPAIVQQVVEMGFSEERVREALRRVRKPSYK